MTKKQDTSLGSLVTSFHVQPLAWRHVLLIFIPLCLVILSLVGYGYWRAIYGYTNYGPVASRAWGQPWFTAATGLTLPLLLYALRRIHRAKTRVDVHTQGLTVHRPPNRKTSLRWEDIGGLTTTSTKESFLGWKSNPRHKIVIHPKESPPIKLDRRINHLVDLATLLKKQVYPRVLPTYQESFRNGKRVHFGSLTLSKDHLSYGEKDVPWSYVEGITAKDGDLIIQLSPQKRLEIPANRIQNMELLVKFIKEEVRS